MPKTTMDQEIGWFKSNLQGCWKIKLNMTICCHFHCCLEGMPSCSFNDSDNCNKYQYLYEIHDSKSDTINLKM